MLDQSRVVGPLRNEKNYHIFYQMLAGLNEDERSKLFLDKYSISNFKYLMTGDTHQVIVNFKHARATNLPIFYFYPKIYYIV